MSTSHARTSAAWLILMSICLAAAPRASHAAPATLDGTWSALDTSAAEPIARREFAAIYDIQRHRYLIFAGLGWTAPGPSYDFNEVWSLSLGPTPTWALLAIAGPTPGERHSPQWGYDPARQRLLVFGGYGHHYPGGEDEYLNDVWELSLDGTPEWHEIVPTGTAPVGRLAGVAVYDPLRQRFVGFGGTRGTPVDTWSLDLSGDPAWTTVETDSLSPPGSYGMTSIYDLRRDRLLVFGGSTSDEYWGVRNDLWELSLLDTPTWNLLAPLGTPPTPRRNMASIHDPIRDRMIVFGGFDSQSNDPSSFLNDTWALSITPELHWSQLQPQGPLPPGRNAMDAIYDPLADRMVVFGGWGGNVMRGDTWFLDFGLLPLAPVIAGSSQAEPGAAHVSWSLQNTTGLRAAVYRREPGTKWSSIATIANDGSGALQYDDHAVTPGARYGYQLVVASQLGATFGGEVWVDVPTVTAVDEPAHGLALHPLRPNPVVDRFAVSFDLPGAGPARIEVVDVAGRRIASRDLGSFGPGGHVVDLGSARDYASGLYFVRLTHGGRSRITRAIVSGGATR